MLHRYTYMHKMQHHSSFVEPSSSLPGQGCTCKSDIIHKQGASPAKKILVMWNNTHTSELLFLLQKLSKNGLTPLCRKTPFLIFRDTHFRLRQKDGVRYYVYPWIHLICQWIAYRLFDWLHKTFSESRNEVQGWLSWYIFIDLISPSPFNRESLLLSVTFYTNERGSERGINVGSSYCMYWTEAPGRSTFSVSRDEWDTVEKDI